MSYDRTGPCIRVLEERYAWTCAVIRAFCVGSGMRPGSAALAVAARLYACRRRTADARIAAALAERDPEFPGRGRGRGWQCRQRHFARAGIAPAQSGWRAAGPGPPSAL